MVLAPCARLQRGLRILHDTNANDLTVDGTGA